MIITVDIGNTNIVIGCCRDNDIFFVERVSTRRDATVLEYAITFKNILELYGINKEDIDGAIISSVVPEVTMTVRNAIKQITDIDVKVVGPGLKTGVNIVIDNPAQLGSDLVVDAAAAINFCSCSLIVFSISDSEGWRRVSMSIPIGVSATATAMACLQ